MTKISDLEYLNSELEKKLKDQIKQNNSAKEKYEQQIKYYKNALQVDPNDFSLQGSSTPEHIKNIITT